MRRCAVFFAAAAAASAPGDARMATLHKILIGEQQFRNNAAVKVCNVEHNFGANWKSEIEAYAAKLPDDQKAILTRQIARVQLTRYTTRELGQYGAEGTQHLDAVAKAANIAQGKEYLAKNGEDKFVAYVHQEAKNANWSEADAKAFIDAVKAAK